MNTIKGNIVDIHQRAIYFGEITFDTKIRSISKLDDKAHEDYCYIAPGFIDSHVHIESSMLTPQRFAQMVASHGTIAAVCDPHEIVNVLGLEGFNFMLRDAKKACMKLFFTTPSCVPATQFETNGTPFTLDDTRKALEHSVALAEMMNYPGVIYDDPTTLSKLDLAKSMGKPIDGHCPMLSGKDLEKYISTGISTDHESSVLSEAEEKIQKGMMIQVREGSAAKNFEALYPLFNTNPDKIMTCTDDAHPDDIEKNGHIDRFIRLGKNKGISIYDIYKASLLNSKAHYNLSKVGTLRTNESADFIIIDNLEAFEIQKTYIDGETVYDKKASSAIETTTEDPQNKFIDNYKIKPDDFAITIKGKKANVISASDGSLFTKKEVVSINQSIGEDFLPTDDIVKIAVINRYKKSPISLGLIKGTGLTKGAIASSIAHDSHNVVIIGADNQSMCKAANEIFKIKGGLIVASGNEIASLSLPYAGLMSSSSYTEITDKYNKLLSIAKTKCHTTLFSPFMTMAFMPLLVIPKIKISDKGLFDSSKFEFIPLFLQNE